MRTPEDFDVDVDIELTEDMSEYETDVDSGAQGLSHRQEDVNENGDGRKSAPLDQGGLRNRLEVEQQRQERIEYERASIAELQTMRESSKPVTTPKLDDSGRPAVRRLDTKGIFVKVRPGEHGAGDAREVRKSDEVSPNMFMDDDEQGRVSMTGDPFKELSDFAPVHSFPPDSRLTSQDASAEAMRARVIREGREKRRQSGHQPFLGYDIDEEESPTLGNGNYVSSSVVSSPGVDLTSSSQAPRVVSSVSDGVSVPTAPQRVHSTTSSGGSGSRSDGSGRQGSTEDGPVRNSTYSSGQSTSMHGDNHPRLHRDGSSARRLLFSRPSGPSKEVAEVKDCIKKMVKRYRPNAAPTVSDYGAAPQASPATGSRSSSSRRFVSTPSQTSSTSTHSPHSVGSGQAHASRGSPLPASSQAHSADSSTQSTYSGVAAYSGLHPVGASTGSSQRSTPSQLAPDSQPPLQVRSSYAADPQPNLGQGSLYASAPQAPSSPPLYARPGVPTSPFNKSRSMSGPQAQPQAASLTQFVSNFSVGRTSTYVGQLLTQIGCTVAVKKNNNKMKVEAPYGVGSQVLHASISMEPLGPGPNVSGMPMAEDRTMVTVMRSKEDRGRTEVHEFVSFYHVLRERFEEMTVNAVS